MRASRSDAVNTTAPGMSAGGCGNARAAAIAIPAISSSNETSATTFVTAASNAGRAASICARASSTTARWASLWFARLTWLIVSPTPASHDDTARVLSPARRRRSISGRRVLRHARHWLLWPTGMLLGLLALRNGC